jgi:hypothetical protein
LIDTLCPDKRFRVLVVVTDIFLDRLDKVFDTLEAAASNPFPRDFSEPSLHQVEPIPTPTESARPTLNEQTFPFACSTAASPV